MADDEHSSSEKMSIDEISSPAPHAATSLAQKVGTSFLQMNNQPQIVAEIHQTKSEAPLRMVNFLDRCSCQMEKDILLAIEKFVIGVAAHSGSSPFDNLIEFHYKKPKVQEAIFKAIADYNEWFVNDRQVGEAGYFLLRHVFVKSEGREGEHMTLLHYLHETTEVLDFLIEDNFNKNSLTNIQNVFRRLMIFIILQLFL